jgi:3',5'-cyclic AMP phosphodiesterase CpdA
VIARPEAKVIDDNRHVMIVCADPQVAFEEELVMLEKAVNDMQALVAFDYPDVPVYGIVCGDIIAEIKNEPKFFSSVKRLFDKTGIPFFYVAGNHDMDVTGRSNYGSKKTFEENFGPAYYSFNKGKIHYVVLDDVFFTGRESACIGYLDEIQLNWLEQDLSLVPKGSTVVVALHIPAYSREARRGEFSKEQINKTLQNRRALYKMLEPYNAHIMSGHEHYNENYVLNDHLFEHVHAALCGIFWQAPYNSDGTPWGYAVYEFDGDDVKWYYKVVGKDKNIQFDAYTAGTDKHRPDAVIVNVWNYDPGWKVFWYEDDKKMGEMKQYTGWDPAVVDYVEKNRQNFRYNYVGAGATEHLFYAEPVNKNAKIKIEVIDRFNNVYRSVPRKIE